MDHEVSQWDIEAVDELGCGWPFANQSSSYLPSEAVAPYGTRTLSFSVCNGFANQRVAILSAIAVALETQRALVLPNLLLDGTQYTADEINEYSSYSVPFAYVSRFLFVPFEIAMFSFPYSTFWVSFLQAIL